MLRRQCEIQSRKQNGGELSNVNIMADVSSEGSWVALMMSFVWGFCTRLGWALFYCSQVYLDRKGGSCVYRWRARVTKGESWDQLDDECCFSLLMLRCGDQLLRITISWCLLEQLGKSLSFELRVWFVRQNCFDNMENQKSSAHDNPISGVHLNRW